MLLVADLALIPTRLSPPDMDALPKAKHLVRKARVQTGVDYPVRVVANAARMHMADDKNFLALLQQDKDFPPMECTLGDRKAYSRSMLYGATVHAVPGGEEAVREIEALTDATLKLLGLPKKIGSKK